MAKKKSKSKKPVKAEPAKKAKKEKNSAGWIIGVIVVIVVIIAIILLLRGCAKEEQPTQPTAPTEPTKPAEQAPKEKPTEVSEKPEFVRYCSIDYALGWPKNKLGTPCTVDGNKVTSQIMFSGKGKTIGGVWFEVTTTDGKVKYLKDDREVKQGETLEYMVDVGQHIENMIAYPEITEGGDVKACLNQRLLIVKATECVAG